MKIILQRIVFLLLISSVFATDLWGQRPFFKKIPLPRELSQYSVNCMYQDVAGFIWLGTTRGLYKYTGSQFQHYQAPLELTGMEVTSLFQDRQLRFWIGFQNGALAQLYNNQMQVLDTTAGPASPITAFAQDKNDRLWISTYGNGLYTYEGQKLRQVTEISGLADKDIYDMVIDSLQRIYLGTDNGIMVLPTDDLTQLQQITMDQGLSDNIVVSFTMNNEGNIWAGTYNRGVSLIHSAPLEVKDTRLEWNYGVLMDLQWAADQLWMATENQGILQFDPLTEA
jgi:ligand-binding sensor domain-containing protein